MARSISVVCPKCKQLVPVLDKVIQEHGDCPVGGMRYVPSPRTFKAGPGAPEFEVLATKPVTMECAECGGIKHSGVAALVNVKMPNPEMN